MASLETKRIDWGSVCGATVLAAIFISAIVGISYDVARDRKWEKENLGKPVLVTTQKGCELWKFWSRRGWVYFNTCGGVSE